MLKILLMTIFIIILAAVLLYFFVFTGVIRVISLRPPNATVQIDGVTVGNTPLKQRVRTGAHQIAVSKEGFETWQVEEEVRAFSTSAISMELRFLLRSDPAGAKIFMNGEHIGVTELAVDLKPGMHTFEFRKAGYQTAKFRANIPRNATESVPFVTLRSARATPSEEEVWPDEKPVSPEYGVIQVSSTPDAQVYLDGEFQGETPLTIRDVSVGDYVITLSKEGYRDLRKTVYVKKDETTKFAGELKPESLE